MLEVSPTIEKMRAITGPEGVRAATESDAVSGVSPQIVTEPENEQQLARVLSFANDAGMAVIPRGGGTKLEWGNRPRRADVILSTSRLNRILEHAWADLTVTVEAGCTLQSLQRALAVHGQRLAFDGLWPEHATIGGVLSTNDSGALRLRFGALRDLIIGATIALPDGTLASSGGKVVKNVAGYDLPKLTTGALGTLGVITRAVFRLHPLPIRAKTFSFAAETFQEMEAHVMAIQDSKLAHAALQIRCAAGDQLQADIRFEATETGINAQELQLNKITRGPRIGQSPDSVWNAREELWTAGGNTLIAKMSILPAEIANTWGAVQKLGTAHRLDWQNVLQATGISMLRLAGDGERMYAAARELREMVEGSGGSFVILRCPAGVETLGAWGNPGDSVSLMRAIKKQLDPKGTLNPGRFVGGI